LNSKNIYQSLIFFARMSGLVALCHIGVCLATHLIYSQSSIVLNQTTTLLPMIENIKLDGNVTLSTNQNYAFLFERESGTTRNYNGDTILDPLKTAILHSSSNASWVSPSSDNYFLQLNNGPSTMTTLLAVQSFTLPLPGSTGFGQTITPSCTLTLQSISLLLSPAMTSSNAMNVTLRIYQLASFPGFEFLYSQETANPTQVHTFSTIAPTIMGTSTQSPSTKTNNLGCNIVLPQTLVNGVISCKEVYVPSTSNVILVSDPIDVQLQDVNGTWMQIQDLPDDERITIFITFNETFDSDEISCVWWNGKTWETSGVITERTASARICNTSHLTIFALVIFTQPNDLVSKTLDVNQIILLTSGALPALLSILQIIRGSWLVGLCQEIVYVHGILLAISGCILLSSNLIHFLLSVPYVILLLLTLANWLQMMAQLSLIYLWTKSLATTWHDVLPKLRKAFSLLSICFIVLIMGIPILMFTLEGIELIIAELGISFLTILSSTLGAQITVHSWKLRRAILDASPSYRNQKATSVKMYQFKRINVIVLCSGIFTIAVSVQNIFWAVGMRIGVLQDKRVADWTKSSADMASCVSLIMLLHLFNFGPHEQIVAKSPKIELTGEARFYATSPMQHNQITKQSSSSTLESRSPSKLSGTTDEDEDPSV
jgi:hypothetical protein